MTKLLVVTSTSNDCRTLFNLTFYCSKETTLSDANLQHAVTDAVDCTYETVDLVIRVLLYKLVIR